MNKALWTLGVGFGSYCTYCVHLCKRPDVSLLSGAFDLAVAVEWVVIHEQDHIQDSSVEARAPVC